MDCSINYLAYTGSPTQSSTDWFSWLFCWNCCQTVIIAHAGSMQHAVMETVLFVQLQLWFNERIAVVLWRLCCGGLSFGTGLMVFICVSSSSSSSRRAVGGLAQPWRPAEEASRSSAAPSRRRGAENHRFWPLRSGHGRKLHHSVSLDNTARVTPHQQCLFR